MPQMAPLSWTLLFLSFIVIYAINTTKIYFSSPASIEKSTTSMNTTDTKINWKW